MKPLSPALSRALALALLASVVLAGKYLAVDPVVATQASLAERIGRGERLLAAYEARRKEMVARVAEAEAGATDETNGRAFLAGSNATLVGAELQSRVQSLIEATDGRLISAQILQTQPEDGLRRVVLRTRMTGSIGAVQSVFHALESSTPYLFIDNVSIRKARTRTVARRHTVRRNAARQATPPGHMTVTYDVIGYLRSGDGA